MRIPVYLKKEDPASQLNTHSSSSSLCALVLGDGAGRLLKLAASRDQPEGRLVLKLKTDETWRQLKDRLNPKGKAKGCPRLKAAQAPRSLDLSYPEKGRESVTHPHAAMRNECIRVKIQKEALLKLKRAAAASAQAQESTVV